MKMKITEDVRRKVAREVLRDRMEVSLREFLNDDCTDRLESALRHEIKLYKDFCEMGRDNG